MSQDEEIVALAPEPLWVRPLWNTNQEEEERVGGRYVTYQRLVLEHEEDGEVETRVQVFYENSNHQEVLWRRVVVQSSPPSRTVHASYMLPKEHLVDGNIVCWTTFSSSKATYLCVLASPTLLQAWDVYSGGGGHSIPLPFEACGIFSCSSGGLLLQRKETLEDAIPLDALHKSWTCMGLDDDDDNGDGFVLKAPPRPVRLRESTGTATSTLNSASTTNHLMVGAGPTNNIPSLFSLSHPLDDILPVSYICEKEGNQIFDNVFEKIIFTGVVEWLDVEKQPQERSICVTYHTHKKRHAIWELETSPPPPPSAPLWQVSSEWRCHETNMWNSHLGIDLDNYVLGTNDGINPPEEHISRRDALADALGVRKTPRKKPTAEEPRSSFGGNVTRRATRQPPSSHHKPSNNNNSNNVSLLSPRLNETNISHNTTNSTSTKTAMDVDITHHTAGLVNQGSNKPPLLSLGPFASLYPKVAMNCIHEDSNVIPEAASQVFLISNQQGSGTLTLCLVTFSPSIESNNTKQVQLFYLQPSQIHNQALDIAVGPTVPCIAATPLKASPIPTCFNHDSNNYMATDLLLLHFAGQEKKLSLFRNTCHIVDCAIQNTPTESIFSLQNAVASRVDLTLKSHSNTKKALRVDILLVLNKSQMAERVLQAMESALIVASLERMAMKVRADCIRLQQALLGENIKHRKDFLGDDVEATAVRIVISALFALEWMGLDVHNELFVTEQRKKSSSPKSAWEELMKSQFHQSYDCQEIATSENQEILSEQQENSFWDWQHLATIQSLAVDECSSSTLSISSLLFDALHTMYEEFKLYGTTQDVGTRFIGTVLGQVCLFSQHQEGRKSQLFLDHYQRDLGNKWLQRLQQSSLPPIDKQTRKISAQLSSYESPPCILSWIDAIVSGKYLDCGYTNLKVNASCTRTRTLFKIFKILYNENDDQPSSLSRRDRDRLVVQTLVNEGFGNKAYLRDQLPPGVSLPLLEVLYRCRTSEDQEQLGLTQDDALLWKLIGRDDLYQNAQINTKNVDHDHHQVLATLGEDVNESQQLLMEDKDKDGICPLEITSSMLFPNDNRIREVGRLLRSSRPSHLNVPRAIEVSDHEYERLKQEKLLLLSRRILALPVGRGMFTIGNLQPVPAEPLPLPDMLLVGRVPPTNAMLALDTAESPSDLKVWPEFHNGVAAGLRLPLEADAGEIISKITRTWIVYNRPAESSQPQNNNNNNNATPLPPSPIHAHGGLLMALGLRGHLTTLEMTDIFDYLTQGTVTTTVGVLLGMAVNMRGTCDISVSKMLCLHIPSLIPQHFSAIDVASPVQAAAVAGAGLLYQGSSHRMMTEFLLNEIGKRPVSDLNVLDREAYTLSCGFALGMVNLCRGETVKSRSEASGSGNAGLSDLRIDERLYRYIVGGLDDEEMRRRREETDRLSLPSTSSANEKCACIHEGDSINTDVTAPGATIALGLIYMMSGNKTIASAIALPDTHFLLEYVRPDFLMLRVIGRALILWDSVQPTKAWIESQLPNAVKDAYAKMRELALNISQNTAASSNENNTEEQKDFDRQAIRLIYSHVIAGACFAIGLRFAGTGNRQAAAAIFERVMELRELRDGNDQVSCALRPPAPVLSMCLGCAAISLSMVLAGSGDLEVLRLLKVLRWRYDEGVNYGSHLAYGTAIGLLFLGGGTCTLGREPEDIAALVMAFYPRYPTTTSDNQYHLQALRNLYAIAVKDCELRAIDVDTGESVFVPIQVHIQDSSVSPLEMTAPCLLFNTDVTPKELRVVSERYYPVTLSISDPAKKRIFYVKRKSAHLSYLQDPHSQRSLLVRTGSFQGYTSLDLIASFTDDRKILAFARHFCNVGKSDTPEPFSVSGFCSRVLHECLLLDSEEALPLYLALRSAISSVQAGIRSGVSHVWDFRLIRSYYEQRRRLIPDESPKLLNSEIIAYLSELLQNSIIGLDGKSKINEFGEPVLQDGSISVYFDMPLGGGSDEISEIMDLS